MSAAIAHLFHAFYDYRAGNRPEYSLKIRARRIPNPKEL
jgi:hypothetical protein